MYVTPLTSPFERKCKLLTPMQSGSDIYLPLGARGHSLLITIVSPTFSVRQTLEDCSPLTHDLFLDHVSAGLEKVIVVTFQTVVIHE